MPSCDIDRHNFVTGAIRRGGRTWNCLAARSARFLTPCGIRRQFTLDADVVHDVVHVARILLKTPGFTLIALLVFALGIGATTAILSVADAFFVSRLPVPQPERVMTVWQYNRETGATQQDVAPANAIDWMKRVQSFEAVAVAEPWSVQSSTGREPVTLEAARVSEQFFTVLDAPLLHGRPFLAREYQRGGERVAIFSHSMWKDSVRRRRVDRRSSRAPERRRHVYRRRCAAAGFRTTALRQSSHAAGTIRVAAQARVRAVRAEPARHGYWNVLGRLRPGVSITQARAEFDAVSTQLAREYPQTNKNIAAQIVPLREHLVGQLP